MACIAVPERGEGHHPAFGIADLVVDSLLDVDGAVLESLAVGHLGIVHLTGNITRMSVEPVNAATALVCLFDRCVQHLDGTGRNARS